MSEKTTVSYSTDVTGLLGVVFIVLKLCGVIHWSWWWVTAPFWGGLALLAVILVIAVVAYGIGSLGDWVAYRKRT